MSLGAGAVRLVDPGTNCWGRGIQGISEWQRNNQFAEYLPTRHLTELLC